MKSKFTFFILMALATVMVSCSKKEFSEQDAIAAQKELLDLKYQHEIDLETLKQKGANALQELANTAALNQLKLSDSLTRASANAAKRQDYTVTVVDVVSNAPVADADVTVSAEGKILTAKTNAQGSASFSALLLFPTSSFLITKTGFAATQILQQNIAYGTAKLWNTANLSNEISGTLYIETDLTNITPEKVGANVLVTASASIPNGSPGSYTVSFPTYTTASGTYSLKLPAAPNGYQLKFDQITADQKLFVNATEDDAVKTFPASLPKVLTLKTYYNVNSFNATVPAVNNSLCLKVAADKFGKTLYIPLNQNYYSDNLVLLSAISNKFQVERLNINNYYYNNNVVSIDFNTYTYQPNTKIDVQMIDVAGNIIQTAPLLAAISDQNGKLTYYPSPEGGNGYVHLKRDNSGALVANAKGSFLKAVSYDSFNNLYSLNFNNNLNTAANDSINTTYLLLNKGDKKVVNFYYGSGDSRVKQVY